jgi:hypothetical protein
VGFDEAIEEVSEQTELQAITPRILSEEDRVFSSNHTVFDNTEKTILRAYCESVGQAPMGFNNCQALIDFSTSPDNVISVLRGRTENWKPLFPRRVIV